MNKNEKRS